MFGRKKDTKPPSRRAGQSLAQYGLFDVPNNLDDVGGASDGGDSDLEAELAAIAGGSGKPKPKVKAKAVPQVDLDNMVAESLRDIPSDEELSDGEDDPDLLNELLELADEEPVSEAPLPPPRASRPAPSPPSGVTPAGGELAVLLRERIEMYILAEQNAKATGEASRARRLSRGLKTLKDQLKQAMAGKSVNEEDIPPAVSTVKHENPPPAAIAPILELPIAELPEPIQPSVVTPESPQDTVEEPPVDNELELSDEAKTTLNMLNERKNQYKSAALLAKRSGDHATALTYIKILKQFDQVIAAVKSGQSVDLSNMPGPPGSATPSSPAPPAKQEDHIQKATEEIPAPPQETTADETLITAGSVEEALQQRLAIYKEQEAAAKEAGNSSKARRMGRIVKQFEQAMKQHKAGRPIAYDELPTPPGFAPIPGAPPPPKEESPEEAPPQPDTSKPPEQEGTPATGSADKPGSLGNAGRSNSVRKMGNQLGTGLAGQQLATLLQRQKEFKEAALEAKKKGELAEAKEFLRCAKGFDPLIDAAQGGLPVDLSSVPIPPRSKQLLEESYDIVSAEDCAADEDGAAGLMSRLEQQLTEQLKMCLDTGEHHKAMGDVSGANRFQHLALAVKQDIDVVRMAKSINNDFAEALSRLLGLGDRQSRRQPASLSPQGLGTVSNISEDAGFARSVALLRASGLCRILYGTSVILGSNSVKFHYENKQFSIVQCCTDLGDNDLELTVVRGISYTVANPKDIDTYVKFEFPYPQELPVQDRTVLVKDTNSPEYNAVFTIPINRTARPCLRIFKRQAVKLEVYSRGCCGRPCSCPFPFFSGFFSRDSLIGTINVKLQPLETQTELHDSFDLMNGRKAVGGKLEIKIRVRNPMLTKQIEQTTRKWLVIDH